MCLVQLKDYAAIAQSVVTIFAFALGGWWTWWSFIRTRQRYPKVRLSHSFLQAAIDRNWKLLRVSLRIENQSNILIKPGEVEMRLLRLRPWPTNLIDTLTHKTPRDLQPRKDFLDDNGMLKEGQPDFEWPAIAQRTVTPKKVEIEPNESETLHFDFVIDRRWKVVMVYSYVDNLRKRRKSIGWPLTSTFDLTQGEGTDV